MQHNDLVLGIDGGGTKTHAVLATSSGEIVSEGCGGGSNYHSVGIDSAGSGIRAAVEEAWSKLNREPGPCRAAFLGMAGVVSPADRAVIEGIARGIDLAPPERTEVDHDLRVALAGGTGGRGGVVLIAGTGSSCYGRADDGTSWRAGGWGHLLDDLGGGYWLGLQGIIAVTRHADRRGEPTTLTDVLAAALGITGIRDVLHLLHESPDIKATVASLAPLVLAEAEGGDVPSSAIMAHGAAELSIMVEAVMRSLQWQDKPGIPLPLVGSLLRKNACYRAAVTAAIAHRTPNAVPTEPLYSPGVGAAMLALGLSG